MSTRKIGLSSTTMRVTITSVLRDGRLIPQREMARCIAQTSGLRYAV